MDGKKTHYNQSCCQPHVACSGWLRLMVISQLMVPFRDNSPSLLGRRFISNPYQLICWNFGMFCLLIGTSTTQAYVAVQIRKNICHIEIRFHLSLLRPSETLWIWCDVGTTVFERFALVIVMCQSSCF